MHHASDGGTTGEASMPLDHAPRLVDVSTYPTYKRVQVSFHTVKRMSVKEKRRIFALIRAGNATENSLLLNHGLFVGDFASYYMLSDTRAK